VLRTSETSHVSPYLNWKVSGDIDQDEVRLKIDLQIQVNSVKEWVTVPLALGDVYLAGPPKAVTTAVDGQSMLTIGEQNTQQWHLRGKGLHTISMDLLEKRGLFHRASRRSASIFRQPQFRMRHFGSAALLNC
jgi:hypothetical protein